MSYHILFQIPSVTSMALTVVYHAFAVKKFLFFFMSGESVSKALRNFRAHVMFFRGDTVPDRKSIVL